MMGTRSELKTAAALLTVLLLAGCAGKSPRVDFYVLSAGARAKIESNEAAYPADLLGRRRRDQTGCADNEENHSQCEAGRAVTKMTQSKLPV